MKISFPNHLTGTASAMERTFKAPKPYGGQFHVYGTNWRKERFRLGSGTQSEAMNLAHAWKKRFPRWQVLVTDERKPTHIDLKRAIKRG